MNIEIWDRETKTIILDFDQIMSDAGLVHGKFEDIAVQRDGTIIVCDKCGKFGYIDESKYTVLFNGDML